MGTTQSVLNAPREVAADIWAVAGFVAHLDQIFPAHGASEDYRKAHARFKALADAERGFELTPLYLLWERDLSTSGHAKQVVRAEMLHALKESFPSLLAMPDFALIFSRTREQERLLCQTVLTSALNHAASLFKTTSEENLAPLLAWIKAVPDPPAPVPLNLRTTIPSHNSEWMAFFFRLARELYLSWETKFGERPARDCFEKAFDEIWHRYALLDTFPVVVNLLPPHLLDSEKLAKLSRSQIQQALLQKLGDLNVINTQLAGQNEVLDAMRRELEAAQSGLERRVAERTSELQQLNEELRAAKEHAERADRTKSEFLANMSHELRTPLNAIMGFSEVIRDALFGPVDTHYRGYANDIHQSGRHLLAVINDILDLTKLESGKFELHDEDVSIPELLTTCKEMLAVRATQGGLAITVHAADDLPSVHADPVRLRQIVINLLSNAVKFTPAGGRVIVSARVSRSGEMSIEVLDTGIGMKPEDIAVALEPFRQIDSQLNRSYEGTGLGLPLVKRLTELHGGTLEIITAPAQGTAVIVRLPANRVVTALTPIASNASS